VNPRQPGSPSVTLEPALERLRSAADWLKAPTPDGILSAGRALEQASSEIETYLRTDQPVSDAGRVAQIVQARWMVNQLFSQLGVALDGACATKAGQSGSTFSLEV